jgi:hypothetical protein
VPSVIRKLPSVSSATTATAPVPAMELGPDRVASEPDARRPRNRLAYPLLPIL